MNESKVEFPRQSSFMQRRQLEEGVVLAAAGAGEEHRLRLPVLEGEGTQSMST